MEVPAFMFHRPDGEQQPASDPRDPGQLSERHRTPLHSREMVNHCDGEHRVEGFVAERQTQIVADHHLETKFYK